LSGAEGAVLAIPHKISRALKGTLQVRIEFRLHLYLVHGPTHAGHPLIPRLIVYRERGMPCP
jgi:hypothetical protein